ncbi:hypothetical protein Fleli_0133 [Bernardetia litoralis DSM 6794]|uniref:Uncharacterized protein n=1 Tax=Bernardetia litoralis (strain ATCC 23117 / DSM 6794 / NBRC 15988 / NCIMB 1366 / Fx l1 / Sio-4) TaxID=880071 RepID=I4AF98_BERLS|nr:hypothetical protein [Bernardetia litoralis]AFM02633.1 hypothetical protein Fleli_0133 [Bernardetia litoralis DSM 6794]
MNNQEIIKDIICQVLVKQKSKEIIYKALNEFLPNYEKLDFSLYSKIDDEDYVFESEKKVIDYFINTPNLKQTFYWAKEQNNQDKIMVGANITNDNMLIISLTLDGTLEIERKYYLRLKQFLDSQIGVISYINPVEYDNGQDFIERYELMKYDFEK